MAGLRYADRFPDRQERPDCFGRAAYYSSTDNDCRRCDYFEECGDAVGRRRVIPVRGPAATPTPTYRSRNDGVEASDTRAGEIAEDESGLERFAKDCATGACRGAMWEGYQFFVKFRF